MKRENWPTNVIIISVIVIELLASISFYGEDISQSRSKDINNYTIQGTVMDVTPDLSPENLAELERAGRQNSQEALKLILYKIYNVSSPAAKVTVTVSNHFVAKSTVTDGEGNFIFADLSAGMYALSVETGANNSKFGKRMLSMIRPVTVRLFDAPIVPITLPVRADLITIKGRINDTQGKPVVGAKISGKPYPMPQADEITPPTRFAISGADGTYELRGFLPVNINSVAGYLNGGDPTEYGQYPFYVDVHVVADGFSQDKKDVPRVPLVTERLLAPAHDLLMILNKWETQSKGSSEFFEKQNVPLPSSHGDTITDIDITLQR